MNLRSRSSFAGVFVSLCVFASACGPTDNVNPGIDAGSDASTPPVPAVTSLSPPPGPFNGGVVVTLTTDVPATIHVTTDGSDPKIASAARKSGEGTVTLELTATTTLTFYSVSRDGAEEPVRTAEYVRAGATKGTVSGVVVVDTIAVGHAIGLFTNGTLTDLGSVTQPQEIPFTVTGLGSGDHRVRAMADRNDDGAFLPVFDFASSTMDVTLDLDDPYKASVEGLRLYLGAAAPGRCAIEGTVTHPEPMPGETLRISALSPSSLGQSMDPAALFAQLQDGDLIVTSPQEDTYPYALTDLEPGGYVVSPALTTLGVGGLSINFIANPLKTVQCREAEVATADFAFGPVGLSGQVTLQPQTAKSQTIVYGVVAARGVSLQHGVQVVLMPALFTASPGGADLQGTFAGRGLRANGSFALRVFTNLGGGNPITDALAWAVNVLGGAPAHTSVQTGTTNLTHDFTVQVP